MTSYRELFDASARQHRCLTLRQALDRGVSRSRLARWVHDGQLDRAFRGVYAFPGALEQPRSRLRAATLAVGDPVHAYGETALWLHGLRREAPRRLELLVPHGRRAARLDEVTVHRTRTLVPGDETRARQVPTTTVVRALADLALTRGVPDLHALVLDALQKRMLTEVELARRAGERLDHGARLRLAHVVAKIAPHRADSILEAEARERFVQRGYHPDPAPLLLRIRGEPLTVDVPWSAHKLGIECDGLAFHQDRAALERDHRKTNLLTLEGWAILRLSWARLQQDWDGFFREFEVAARARGLTPTR